MKPKVYGFPDKPSALQLYLQRSALDACKERAKEKQKKKAGESERQKN